MSTREKALYIFNRLTDEQLAAFVTLFSGERFILEEAPDSWDRADGTLNVHIRKIREAIEREPGSPEYIRTVWGEGYRFQGGGQ